MKFTLQEYTQLVQFSLQPDGKSAKSSICILNKNEEMQNVIFYAFYPAIIKICICGFCKNLTLPVQVCCLSNKL